MTPSPQSSPRAPLQLVVHRKSNRIMQVVGQRGRIYVCSWFPDGEDPKKPGAKLKTGPFWGHQLNFDNNAVRARWAEMYPQTPEPGAGNA